MLGTFSYYFSKIKDDEELEGPIEFHVRMALCIFQKREVEFQGVVSGDELRTKEKI